MPPTEAQRRANERQNAIRKTKAGRRVAVFLEQDDAKQLDKLKTLWRLPSRLAALRKLMDRAFGG